MLSGITEASQDISFPAMAERQQALAKVILQDPGQYLWGYHRYKQPRAQAAESSFSGSRLKGVASTMLYLLAAEPYMANPS